MASTMEKLNSYSSALTKWADKKRRYDLQVEANKKPRKELEPEPMPIKFEIGPSEIAWAEKIRMKIMAPKPAVVSLESQLPKIKMPIRKTV